MSAPEVAKRLRNASGIWARKSRIDGCALDARPDRDVHRDEEQDHHAGTTRGTTAAGRRGSCARTSRSIGCLPVPAVVGEEGLLQLGLGAPRSTTGWCAIRLSNGVERGLRRARSGAGRSSTAHVAHARHRRRSPPRARPRRTGPRRGAATWRAGASSRSTATSRPALSTPIRVGDPLHLAEHVRAAAARCHPRAACSRRRAWNSRWTMRVEPARWARRARAARVGS